MPGFTIQIQINGNSYDRTINIYCRLNERCRLCVCNKFVITWILSAALDGLINLINSGLTTWKNPGFSSGFGGQKYEREAHNRGV